MNQKSSAKTSVSVPKCSESTESSFKSDIRRQNTDWIEKQKHGFTLWVNSHLQNYNLHIDDLFKNFQSGINLYCLVCHLAKVEMIGAKKQPKHKLEMICLLSKAFKVLSDHRVKIVNISPEDIYDQNEKLILGLIWTLILHFQLGQLSQRIDESVKFKTDMELLQFSIASIITIPSSIKFDLTKDSFDGKVFYGLVHSVGRKSPIDIQKLVPLNQQQYFEKGIDDAEKYLKVPKMIDTNDMISASYDKKILLTYLSSIILAEPDVSCLPPLETIEMKEEKDSSKDDSKCKLTEISNVSSRSQSSSVIDDERNAIPNIIKNNRSFDVLIPIVNLEGKNSFQKSNSGAFLIDANKLSLLPTSFFEIYLIKQESNDYETDLHKLNTQMGKKNIFDVTYENLPSGLYDGFVFVDKSIKGKLSHPISIRNDYKPKILTKVLTKDLVKGFPVSFIFDRSDFVNQEILMTILGGVRDLVSLNYSSNMTYITFIPATTDEYEINYYFNDNTLIPDSSVKININKDTYNDLTRPLPIGLTPYKNNLFKKESDICIFDPNENSECLESISKDTVQKIECDLLYKNSIKQDCSANILSKTQLEINFTPNSTELAVIDSKIIKKDGSKLELMCQPIIIESNNLYVGEQSDIGIYTPESTTKVKQILHQNSNRTIDFESTLSKCGKLPIEEVKIRPLLKENLEIKFNDSEDSFIFNIQEVDKNATEVILKQKYFKNIPLQSHHDDGSNIFIQLLDPKNKDVPCSADVKNDLLTVNFRPEIPGVYHLTVKENNVDVRGSPFMIHCSGQSEKEPRISYVEKIESDDFSAENSQLKLVSVETNNSELLPLRVCYDSNNKKFAEVIVNFPEAGNYVLEHLLNGKPKKIYPNVFYAKPRSERFCFVGVLTKFVVLMDDLHIKDVTQKIQCNYKILDENMTKGEIDLFFQKSEQTNAVDIIFVPNEIGLLSINPKIDKKPIFKNRFTFLVKDKAYEKVNVDEKSTKIDDSSENMILFFKDCSNLKFYNDYRIQSLEVQILQDEEKVYQSKVLMDIQKDLFINIQRSLPVGRYSLQLYTNKKLIKGSITPFYILQTDSNRYIKPINLENDVEEEQKCNCLLKGELIESSILQKGVNQINLKSKFTTVGPYEIISECTTFSKNFPALFIISSHIDDSELKQTEKIIILDKNPNPNLYLSKVEIQNCDTNESEVIVPTQIDNNLYALDIEPSSNDRNIVITEPNGSVKRFIVKRSSKLLDEEQLKTDQNSVILDLPISLVGKSIDQIMEEALFYDSLISSTFEPEGIAELVGEDKIKIRADFHDPGQHLIFVTDRSFCNYFVGKAALIDVPHDTQCGSENEISVSGSGLKRAVINKESKIKFQCSIIKINEIDISFSPPDVDLTRTSISDKVAEIIYTPKVLGTLSIYIKYKGICLKNYPYLVKVSNYKDDFFQETLKFTPQKTVRLSIQKNLNQVQSDFSYLLMDPNDKTINNKAELLHVNENLNISHLLLIFNPTIHGKYTLLINNRSDLSTISKTEFYISPWYPINDEPIVFGNCLQSPVVGINNEFVVLQSQQKFEDLRVSITGIAESDIEVMKKSDFLTVVSWMPHIEGQYTINIFNANNDSINGFPLAVQSILKCDLEKKINMNHPYKFTGDGLKTTIVGYPSSFFVSSKNEDVKNVTAVIKGPQTSTITEENSSTNFVFSKRFTYTVTSTGSYTITLTLNGKNIGISPYIVRAIDIHSEIDSIRCNLDSNVVVKTKRISQFFIDVSNSINPNISVNIQSLDNKVIVPVYLKKLHNNIYVAEFTCPRKHSYYIEILNHGIPINGSPFQIKST